MPAALRLPGSLRSRVLLLAVLTIALALLAAGGALVLVFENHLLRRVEQELEVRWSELAKAFELDDAGRPFLNHEPADPRYLQPYGAAYWQVSGAGGPVLRSRSLWDAVLRTDAVPESVKSLGAFEINGPNGSELYVIEHGVTLNRTAGQESFMLLVALDHADIKELRQAFAVDVAKVLALIALVLAVGAFLQLRFGLSPLQALRDALGEVRTGRARRFSGRFPSEIAPLVEDLNSLLDRQDDLVEKARNRAGSLAHGLKTPLTILAGEIARLEREGQTQRSEILRAQCDAIREHIERELARARTHGAVSARGARTELRPLVVRLVELMRRVERDARIDWRIEVPDGAYAAIEASDLAEILGNLLDNARKWASKSVCVAWSEAAGRAFLTVADDGPGVAPELRESMLERGVHMRVAGEQSSGLGLAIVRDTLAEYGLAPEVLDGAQGCRVRFEIGPVEPRPKRAVRERGAAPADDAARLSPPSPVAAPPHA